MGSRRAFMTALVTDESPDVILGDFNGSPTEIFAEKLQEKDSELYMNLQKYGPYKRAPVRFQEWKNEPFEVLKQSGYVAASDGVFRGTSIFGDMVDWIFVKKDRFRIAQHWIVPMFDDENMKNARTYELKGISDHHAVCCRLELLT